MERYTISGKNCLIVTKLQAMEEHIVRILGIEQVTHDVKRFRIENRQDIHLYQARLLMYQ
jgi:hypothetical protein